MNVDTSKYTSFEDYMNDMPFGMYSWISERTNITTMTLQRIAKRTNKPFKKTVAKICSVTGLNPSVFEFEVIPAPEEV